MTHVEVREFIHIERGTFEQGEGGFDVVERSERTRVAFYGWVGVGRGGRRGISKGILKSISMGISMGVSVRIGKGIAKGISEGISKGKARKCRWVIEIKGDQKILSRLRPQRSKTRHTTKSGSRGVQTRSRKERRRKRGQSECIIQQKKVGEGRKRGPSTASGVWEAGESRWEYGERERGKKRGKSRFVKMCKNETDVYRGEKEGTGVWQRKK